eukprot:171476_1
MSRSYKKRKVSMNGEFIAVETEEFEQTEAKQDGDEAAAVFRFLLDEDDDNKMNDQDVFRSNNRKIDSLQTRLYSQVQNQRLIDAIVYEISLFKWYCNLCKDAGVIRCGINMSNTMTVRAIVNHLLTDTHYKYCTPQERALMDAWKSMYMFYCFPFWFGGYCCFKCSLCSSSCMVSI